jgi:hypothetical protein
VAKIHFFVEMTMGYYFRLQNYDFRIGGQAQGASGCGSTDVEKEEKTMRKTMDIKVHL